MPFKRRIVRHDANGVVDDVKLAAEPVEHNGSALRVVDGPLHVGAVRIGDAERELRNHSQIRKTGHHLRHGGVLPKDVRDQVEDADSEDGRVIRTRLILRLP